MIRTLSARSTTVSHDHEIDAHRAHNAPRDACRGRPRPRPPQDQAVFRGRGSDANRIDCDGQSRCSGACEPAARFGPGARLAANLVQDAAPTRTASIATAEPAAPAPVSPPPVSAPAPATPEPEPPRRMTASQEASLDAWMIKTYLACWNPAAQPADANPYVARVRLKFKPDGSLLKPPKLVNPPSDPAQKPQARSVLQAVKACDPLQMPAQYRSFYGQWKTKTIRFPSCRPLTPGMSRQSAQSFQPMGLLGQ